jgi:hypothetical protein
MDRFAKFICSAENRCARMTTLMSLKFKFPPRKSNKMCPQNLEKETK